jgi:hypothetical protein
MPGTCIKKILIGIKNIMIILKCVIYNYGISVNYVQLKFQLDVLFYFILYSSLFFALHVSGAICTHPQEHKLQRSAIGVCSGMVC